jgi:hypothetical protein
VKLSVEVLSGKHGAYNTFAGDGLHRLYACFLHNATKRARAKGED